MAGGRTPQCIARRVQRIGNIAEIGHFATQLLQQTAQGEAIRVVDRTRPQRLAGHGQFITGEEHRDFQAAEYRQRREAD